MDLSFHFAHQGFTAMNARAGIFPQRARAVGLCPLMQPRNAAGLCEARGNLQEPASSTLKCTVGGCSRPIAPSMKRGTYLACHTKIQIKKKKST